MHESVRAREIEEAIREAAREKNIENIRRVVVKIGKGDGESREDIRHIIEEHMNLDNFEILEEEIALKCTGCGRVYKDIDTLRCAQCGCASFDIEEGMGFKVISVE